MKKLLIASTALVATASVAAAEINFGGYGRFGLLYEEDRDGGEETRFESRFRLNIDGITTTDGGVRFAARIRVQADDNADNTADAGSFGGARFQVSAGGFRVRAGNISGVTDSAIVVNYFGFEPGLIGQTGQYANFGASFDAFGSSSPGGAEGAGGVNGINVLYEVGDFAIMGSYSEDQDENEGATESGREERYEIGASYTFSGWTVGAVYGDAESDGSDGGTVVDNDWWVLTASGSLGPADVVFFAGDTDVDDDPTFGISGSIPVGASTDVVASISDGGADENDTSYGIGFVHSLGGGVSLSGMLGSNADSNTIADLGVRFNF